MQFMIKLDNCAFFARHGVYSEEEKLGQRFFVDVELRVESEEGLTSDDIDTTVDYGIAFTQIEKIVTGTRRYLIEVLAMDIAKALLKSFPNVQHAAITIRKPNAPVPGILDYVEVRVECERE